MSNKTARLAARLTYENKNKLKRYYEGATLRQVLEALIKISEKNDYIRNKMRETIQQGEK